MFRTGIAANYLPFTSSSRSWKKLLTFLFHMATNPSKWNMLVLKLWLHYRRDALFPDENQETPNLSERITGRVTTERLTKIRPIYVGKGSWSWKVMGEMWKCTEIQSWEHENPLEYISCDCLTPFVHYEQTIGGLHMSHLLFHCKLFPSRVAQLCSMPITGSSQPVLWPWTKPINKPQSVKITTSNAGRRAPQSNTTGSPFASIYFVFRCLLSQNVPQIKSINWLSILTPNLSEYAFKWHLSHGTNTLIKLS